jgi:hypothetical protein
VWKTLHSLYYEFFVNALFSQIAEECTAEDEDVPKRAKMLAVSEEILHG